MHTIRSLAAALLLAAVPANAGDADLTPAERLAPFKRDLQAALKQGLAQGPRHAIEACQLRAPEIAAAHAEDGLRVGRTSHRLRNPANAPPAWTLPILDTYRADPSNRAPRTVALPGGRTGYVEPIVTQALCLSCHGSELSPELAEHLAALYPDDRATGFAEGELRGVFWMELPAD